MLGNGRRLLELLSGSSSAGAAQEAEPAAPAAANLSLARRLAGARLADGSSSLAQLDEQAQAEVASGPAFGRRRLL
jgi:hypothetical protein